jgi:hypothetical protein
MKLICQIVTLAVLAVCLLVPCAFAAEAKSESIRGAIYLPAEAYNAPQMWKNFSLAETRRDFGHARAIHLNALRVWASYEYWEIAPEKFKQSFDQMLAAADANGIRILVSLFERCGIACPPGDMWSTNPLTAFAVISPNPEVFRPGHTNRWEAPRSFLVWFMQHYRNDQRLLAIEVMNEPQNHDGKVPPSMPFAKSMFTTAKSLQGTVPLTIGSDTLAHAGEFIPLGLDVIEFHDNFPANAHELETNIQAAVALGEKHHLPVWLTEWQRVRPGGTGWGDEPISSSETTPDYASLAATVRKYPVGNFFWSLMVKKAYLRAQRMKGTINGLFWPDGAVWSLADARAIADDPSLHLPERQTLPPGYLGYLRPTPQKDSSGDTGMRTTEGGSAVGATN